VRMGRTVYAWDPSPENLVTFGRVVSELGLAYAPQSECQAAAANADILITATPSKAALVEKSWVRAGTHISAMGADTKGKQELDPALVASAVLFVDEAEQAISIGECQHAFNAGLITAQSFRGSIGAVIAGLCEGRRSAHEITLFDGTGVALQDLVVAQLAVRLATERGLGLQVAC
jgi:alanine dehydrogenase